MSSRLKPDQAPQALGALPIDLRNLPGVVANPEAEMRPEPSEPHDDPDRAWWLRHVSAWATTFPRWHWARLGDKRFGERMAKAVHFARAVERWTPDAGNVAFVGATGTGKTMATVATMHRLLDRVLADGHARSVEARLLRRSYFVRVAELARSVREHPLGSGVAPDIRRAMTASWLVLDDLANEPPGFESLALEILDERYHHQRVTFVTSGFTRRQIVTRYGDAFLRRLVEPKGAILEAWPGGPA